MIFTLLLQSDRKAGDLSLAVKKSSLWDSEEDMNVSHCALL